MVRRWIQGFVDTVQYPMLTWRSTKERIMMLSPEEKFELVHNFTTMILLLTGCAATDRDYTKTLLTGITGYVILSTYALTVYSTVYYIHDLVLAVESLIVIGITIPNLLYYLQVVFSTKKLQSVIFFGQDYLYSNVSDPELDKALAKQADRYLRRSCIQVLAILLSMLSTVLYPTFAFFFLDKRVLFANLILPGFDPDTHEGFYINTANLALIAALGIPGNVGIELLNQMVVNNLQIGAVVINFKLDKLNGALKKNSVFTVEMKELYKSILMSMQDLDNYVRYFNQLFYWKFLVQPTSMVFLLVGCVFCILTANYKQGFGVIVFGFCQMWLLGNMGADVKAAFKCLEQDVYASAWYNLPLEEQRIIAHALHGVQNAARLTVGPLSDIDHEMTAKLTSGVYRYTNILRGLVGES